MNEPSDPTPQEQPGFSMVPDPQIQKECRKRKRRKFYGLLETDISPTSSLESTISSKTKKKNAKKQETKNSATEESVVALIQNAEQIRISSPPRPDIQIGQVSPTDPRTRYYEYEQERKMSVWDAVNEI